MELVAFNADLIDDSHIIKDVVFAQIFISNQYFSCFAVRWISCVKTQMAWTPKR